MFDFGGATSFEIPNAANPIVDATGEMAIETTSSSARYYDGSNEMVLSPYFDKSYWLASTTIDHDSNSFDSGTTTHTLWNPSQGVELVNLSCKTDTGTLCLFCGDGTNITETIVCDATGEEDDLH